MNNKYLFFQDDTLDRDNMYLYFDGNFREEAFLGQPINYFLFQINVETHIVTKIEYNNYEMAPYFSREAETLSISNFFKLLKRHKKFYFMKQIEKILFSYI